MTQLPKNSETLQQTKQLHMNKAKIIVTGGCGFIGSHLVDELINQDYRVIVIDDLSAESNEKFYFNNKAVYVQQSILDTDLDSCFWGTSYVFHLAAESRIGPCINNPKKAADTNIMGTLNLLQYAHKYNVTRFIYSSTSAVYGLNCKLPTTTDSPIDCLNPYSTTKYCGEELVRLYTKMFGLDSCIFRYFNVFGERSPTTGPYAPVVGLFLKRFQEQERLNIVGDGEQRRDFIHVKDIVRANILAMQTLPKLNAQTFNVGSGKNYTINEIAKTISNDIKYIDSRPGEARDTLANIGDISGLFGWNPTIDVINWTKEQINNK